MPAPALRLNGVSMATWQSAGPFPPGRLDFVLHAPSSLAVLKAFPFDAADLAPQALSRLGLNVEDSRAVSDHLPVVVDYVVRR